MKSEEFLKQLEALLADLSYEEREEAMEYYRNYFADAGEENEEQVLAELGSPQKVAQSIKDSLDNTQAATVELPPLAEENGADYTDAPQSQNGPAWWQDIKSKFSKLDKTLQIVLIVLAVIFLLPVAGSVISAAFGLLGGLIGLVFGFIGVTIGGVVGGIGLVIGGIAAMATGGVMEGILIFGFGMLLLAVGILCLIALLAFGMYFVPWLVREVQLLYHKVWQKNGGMKNEK